MNVVGIQFRTAGKIFPYNATNLVLKRGDEVVVETSRGVAQASIVMDVEEYRQKFLEGAVENGDLDRALRSVLKRLTPAPTDPIATPIFQNERGAPAPAPTPPSPTGEDEAPTSESEAVTPSETDHSPKANDTATQMVGLPKILRRLNSNDFSIIDKNLTRAKYAYTLARKKSSQHRLDMKFIRVEYLIDSSKAIFYYVAEGRVDFRNLVKDLAKELRTRIEMRQIGVRDAAKLLGGVGICGRELCCTTWLRDFDPISINMAKDQNLTLNPFSLSGRCGRLRCCLRYEHSTYLELAKEYPKVGAFVILESGLARVRSINVLTRALVCESNVSNYIEVGLDQLVDKSPTPEKVKELQDAIAAQQVEPAAEASGARRPPGPSTRASSSRGPRSRDDRATPSSPRREPRPAPPPRK